MQLRSQKGFTLFEMLLYIGIASIVIGAISTLLFITLNARVKNQTIAEVEQQGAAAMHIITQAIRNSESITTPTSGSADTLTLNVVAATEDPTVINLSGTTLQLTGGTGAPVALTNNRVTVSNLAFTNLTQSGAPGSIQISFTITHVNTSGRQEYNFSQDFITSASLR